MDPFFDSSCSAMPASRSSGLSQASEPSQFSASLTPQKTIQNSQSLSFEESVKRLEEIVAFLDGGRCDLQTSLERYEEGVHLLKTCHQMLEGAKRRIGILRGFDEQGQPIIQESNDETFRSDVSTPGRQSSSVAVKNNAAQDANPLTNSGASDSLNPLVGPHTPKTAQLSQRTGIPKADPFQTLQVSSNNATTAEGGETVEKPRPKRRAPRKKTVETDSIPDRDALDEGRKEAENEMINNVEKEAVEGAARDGDNDEGARKEGGSTSEKQDFSTSFGGNATVSKEREAGSTERGESLETFPKKAASFFDFDEKEF